MAVEAAGGFHPWVGEATRRGGVSQQRPNTGPPDDSRSSAAVASSATASSPPPPAHLATFSRERITFLSVCDGWVVAQTASGLAAAFPMALPPSAPLAVQLQPRLIHHPTEGDARALSYRSESAPDGASHHAGFAAAAPPLTPAPATATASWPIVHLNLRPGHVVHCTYLNPRSRPCPTLITCVSDETFHLRCFATPLRALGSGQSVVEAVTLPVFTEDAFRHPGFVEANSVNNTALTYGCAAGASNADGMRYRVWELDSYTPVVTVPDTGVVDVK